MNIVCRKTKCKYNNCQACMRKSLVIDSELNCCFYETVQKDSVQDVSKNMLEIAPEIAPFSHSKNVAIKCKANCIFNKCNECMANGILVNGQTTKENEKVNEIINDDELCQQKKNKKKWFHIGKERNKGVELGKDKCVKECKIKNEDLEKMCIFDNCDFELIDKEDLQLSNNESGQAKCFTFVNR